MMDPTTALAKPAADLAVLLLKPLIDKLQEGLSNASQIAYHNIFNSYRCYLTNAFQRHAYFTSIVFQNQQKKLEDYYLPLTLVKVPENEETTITGFPRDIFKTVGKILVVDSAGMGKTTLLKYLFLCCVKETAGIPIYIELRKLSNDKSILSYIQEQLADLADLNETPQSHLVYKLLDSGEFVLFLDGYDEIPEDQRMVVTAGLQSLMEKAPRNKCLMTSREEIGLTAFSQFQRFKIRPLQKEEAYTLLRKYSEDNLATILITKLEQPENIAIHEFLGNPLLTSLLYKSFQYKHIVPLKKHYFYRQVFDALYEMHDLTKEGEFQREKKSRLDIDQFDRILRSLAYISYRNEKVEFSKDELLALIGKAKKLATDTNASASNILHDLTHAVPLMVEEGNYIRWTHKSIGEYFAAQYICKDTGGNQKEMFLKYLYSQDFTKHVNLITLCADIDRPSFKHSIAKQLAEAFLNEYNSIYVTGFLDISPDLIVNRKCLTAGRRLAFTRMDLPLDFYTGEVDFMSYEKYLSPIYTQMIQLIGSTEYGSEISWANPGLGEAFTALSLKIRHLHRVIEFPFIDAMKKGEINNTPDFVEKLAHLVPQGSGVEIINDDPVNPLNQKDVFELINRLIERYAGWKFNAQNACKFLEEIENESKAQKELIGDLAI